ncbi:MAG TPA: hypothetical protein VNW25_06765 [Candidatus Sulfotelmatobacter sp.]|nr:hypothetical protein [Candidatus Sulfotelmatobacter sp.]
MAFREDWTRITHSIHGFLQAFRSPTRLAIEKSHIRMENLPRPRPASSPVRRTTNGRLLAEIERKRNPAYMSSLKNQMR